MSLHLEVTATQGFTCSRHDLLDVLVLLVFEAILLLIVVLVVVLVAVVILVGVVILLPLGADDDEVGGVAALEAAPGVLGVASPLLLKLVHCPKFLCKHGNLVVRNALIFVIGSCSKRRQSKLQRGPDGVSGVSILATNMSTSNQSFLVKEAS
jgi:hypothetical protein